jgi:protein tyrosine phosphatase (PTP) superfamily phosphohydrolase (DUF442 family)
MTTRFPLSFAARVLAFLTCGLIVSTAVMATAPSPGSDELFKQLSGVPNLAHPYPWLITGGQPDATALAALAKAGVRDIFDLRAVDEPRAFDERAACAALGLRYLPIPIGPGDLSDSKFTAFRHHLIAHGPGLPMFVHCSTGNRVGAALLPWLVLDEGVGEDLALEMAHGMGLKDADLTQMAEGYIHAHEAPAATR